MRIDTSLIIFTQIEFQTLIKKFIKSIMYQKTSKKIKEHLVDGAIIYEVYKRIE